jgi:hypothetical protein
MGVYNWISLALILIGWAVTYGKLCQKINQMEKRQDQVDADLKALRVWGESEIAKQIAYRETHFVNKDVLNQCLIDITRRLDEVNTIELNSRLSRIEAQLDQIQITLSERK